MIQVKDGVVTSTGASISASTSASWSLVAPPEKITIRRPANVAWTT